MERNRPSYESICSAMLDLLEEQPLDTISVTDLTKRAGVSRTSFYRYFETTYDVVQAIEDDYDEQFPRELQAVQDLLELGNDTGNGTSPQELEYAQVIVDSFRTYRILTGPNGEPSFEAHMRNRISRIFSQALEAKLGRGPKTEVATAFLTGARMSLLEWWGQHEKEVDPVEFSRYCSAITVSSMRAIADTTLQSDITF